MGSPSPGGFSATELVDADGFYFSTVFESADHFQKTRMPDGTTTDAETTIGFGLDGLQLEMPQSDSYPQARTRRAISRTAGWFPDYTSREVIRTAINMPIHGESDTEIVLGRGRQDFGAGYGLKIRPNGNGGYELLAHVNDGGTNYHAKLYDSPGMVQLRVEMLPSEGVTKFLTFPSTDDPGWNYEAEIDAVPPAGNYTNRNIFNCDFRSASGSTSGIRTFGVQEYRFAAEHPSM